jgi:uncharacterized NAD(P)/FAD-binding protein YdhS
MIDRQRQRPTCDPNHYGGMKPTVVFVGAGPTTIYTLSALIDAGEESFSLTIFEQQSSAGRGTPYRHG